MHPLIIFSLFPTQGIIEKYGLALQSSGFFAGYDININSGIANSVSSQALKFVASLMPNTVAYFDVSFASTVFFASVLL